MKSRSKAPVLLALIIGTFVLFLAWSANRAATGGTDITDPDYYSKGMKYNSTLIEKKAAGAIGWTLIPRLKENRLILALRDKNGTEVTGAEGRVIFPVPGGNRAKTLPLRETNRGHYEVILPDSLPDEQLTRVDIERNGARIYRQFLLNLSKTGPVPEHEEHR